MVSSVKSFIVAAVFAGATVLMGCGVEELPAGEPQPQEEVMTSERSAMSTCTTSADCAAPDALCCTAAGGGGGSWDCYGWSRHCTTTADCPTGFTCYTSKGRCASWYAVCN
jgi:hypothetical protein